MFASLPDKPDHDALEQEVLALPDLEDRALERVVIGLVREG